MNDPNIDRDRTEDWEKEIDKRDGPKIKFPVKATGENIENVSVDFPDPKISDQKTKQPDIKKDSPKVLDISKKGKKKNNKTKLF